MARIGTVQIEAGVDGVPRSTAIVFWLKTKSGYGVQVVPPNSHWEVELAANQSFVVARSRKTMPTEAALYSGREAVDQALDRICFKYNDPLEIKSQDDEYLFLSVRNGKGELTYYTQVPFNMRISPVKVVVTDKNGNEVPDKRPPSSWMPVLRYYRLSQARDDIFDAYRYMFLAFEALIESLYPIARAEGEHAWMSRTLGEIGKKIDLRKFVPKGAANPVQAFIDRQYGETRLRLFHAKKSASTKPHEGLAEVDVQRAYSDLTRFCREVLNELYQLGGQSAALTNYAFQTGLGALLTDGSRFACSSDSTPLDPSESKFCPQGAASYSFETFDVAPESNVGERRVSGSLKVNDVICGTTVNRVGIVRNEVAAVVSTFDSGLSLEGIETFKCEMLFKLSNLNLPRHTG